MDRAFGPERLRDGAVGEGEGVGRTEEGPRGRAPAEVPDVMDRAGEPDRRPPDRKGGHVVIVCGVRVDDVELLAPDRVPEAPDFPRVVERAARTRE